MNEEYQDFIKSDEWKERKNQLISERGLFCEKCGIETNKINLHLHHKNYDMEFGLEKDEDLMLVCGNCHNELHQDKEFFKPIELKKAMGVE